VDNKQVIQWITAAAARGIAWVLAGKLGLAAATADDLSTTIAASLAALAVAGFSIYSSVKGRRQLLLTDPPRS
jgi:hypothetical protein